MAQSQWPTRYNSHMSLSRYREFWSATAAIIAFVVLMGSAGAGGWPGKPSDCIIEGDCYCETLAGGIIEQPANTLSNIGFLLVGLSILAGIGAARSGSRREAPGNPMTRREVYPTVYGSVAVFLGLGSAAFHGTITEWGGWVDLVSMYSFILFLLGYNLSRLGEWSDRRFLSSYASATVLLAAIQWPLDNGFGKYIFGALIVVTLVTEARLAGKLASPIIVSRDRRWLWGGLGVYVFGSVVWALSRTDGVLCSPDTVFQGHALWHLTAAAAVGLLYAYLRSETEQVHAPATPGTAT